MSFVIKTLAVISIGCSVAAPAVAGDIAAGEVAFKKCVVCHAVGEGAKNKIGPVLNGLDGRTAGTVAGFKYSAANQKSGIVWGEAVFKEYIQNPRAKIPGTTMVFVGIKNEKESDDLWTYLKQFGSDGKKK